MSASRFTQFIPRVLSPIIERNGMGLGACTDVVRGRDPQPLVQLPSGFPVRASPSHHTTLHLSCPLFSALQLPSPTNKGHRITVSSLFIARSVACAYRQLMKLALCCPSEHIHHRREDSEPNKCSLSGRFHTCFVSAGSREQTAPTDF